MMMGPATVPKSPWLGNASTTTVKLLVTLNAGNARSVTTVVKRLVLGTCAPLGVHRIKPWLSIVAPSGGLMS